MEESLTHPRKIAALLLLVSACTGGTPGLVRNTLSPVVFSDEVRAEPTAGLRGDAFDAPAPEAVAEAKKAAANIPDGDIRHIVPGTDRAIGRKASTAAPEPAGHEHHAAPEPRPAASSAPARPEAPTALYVCPMHPEVTSNEPGTCPKCGMALVRKK
jgi:hypothetical protein